MNDGPSHNSPLRVFLTGGSGFVGSHVIDQLIAAGHRVHALVRSSSSADYVASLGAETVCGGLEDEDALAEGCEKSDVVIHAAARVDMTGSDEDFQRTTVDATRNISQAAKRAGIKRFVHISSCGVYHTDLYKRGVTITEETPTPEPPPWFPYGRFKHRAEQVVRDVAGDELDFTILRLGYLFGPRNRAMPLYMLPAMTDSTMRIVGNGKNEIAVVYVIDVANAIVKACAAPGASKQTLILGGFERVTQQEYYDAYADCFGIPRIKKKIPYPIAFYGAWLGEKVKHKKKIREISVRRAAVVLTSLPQRIDCSKTQKILDWQPTTTFKDGMKITTEWYREEANL